MRAWVAAHTNLPSFRFQGRPGGWFTVDAVDEAGRSWVAVAARTTGGVQALSDPLALPGVPVTYTVRGTGETVRLERPTVEWWRGLVSRMDWRVIPDLVWEKNGDPRGWTSGVKRFNAQLARWPLRDEAVTGAGRFVLMDPGYAPDLWRLLQRHEPLLVVPGEPTAGLPPRVVTVDKVTSKRLTGDGWLDVEVDWTEVPLDSPMLASPDGTRGAGVVTWGEWDAVDGAWARRTYAELCTLIAGMPA